jgi:glyoxylase-like metal-dependent hydrolase (beta-lactamase superfamily II)
MKLHVINTGFFKLDGGAMFGVVPKSIWQRTNPADDRNLCTWAMRCLLVEEGNRLILIDNGIGNKQDPGFFKFFYLHGEDTLENSLKQAGFQNADITDNILTHLHFDHCGGGLTYNRDRTKIHPLFKNAVYWSHSLHWDWAIHPNAREKASFLPENILPLQKSGQLSFIDEVPFSGPSFQFLYVNGHTEKQIIPFITYKNRTVVFVADLLPSIGHIPLPYVMGYDTRPLLTMEEKAAFLKEAAENEYILFLEHDPIYECCTVMHTDKGVRLKDTFLLKDI